MSKSKSLKEIYALAVEKLRASELNMDSKMKYYRELDCKDWSNDDFLETMAETIFSSNLDYNTRVKPKWSAITEAFSNFNIHKVAGYSEKDVQRLMKNQEIIKNEERIKAVIANAKKMEGIIKEYGSFAKYIDSFSSDDLLVEKLQGQYDGFKGIGEVNVYEFLKEIGLPFIKPDRQIRKAFSKLGLIGKKATLEDIVQIGKDMAKAVNEKPAVVDWVLWEFGKLN